MFNGLYLIGFVIAGAVILAEHLRSTNEAWRRRHEGEPPAHGER